MIDISKLYCQADSDTDGLRYGKIKSGKSLKREAPIDQRPVVVWNITRECNLFCKHCYSNSGFGKKSSELTEAEAFKVIDQLAEFGVPVILFSGGEPLMRRDILTLVEYSAKKGIHPVVSTNGTMLGKELARDLKNAGLRYAGISLDGMETQNDDFRGMRGAFKKAVKGFENCQKAGLRSGLRMTLTRNNFKEVEDVFTFIRAHDIKRACFYHLVYSGRGKEQLKNDLSHTEARQVMDLILKKSSAFSKQGADINILTVDNHADGVYLYLKLLKEYPDRAARAYQLLKWNGGAAYSTGVGIACIDAEGNVHADQFWENDIFGNVLTANFADIWQDMSNPLLAALKDKASHLKGRCRVCKYQEICNGGMRVRARYCYQDPWAPDPQCYLSDEEIGLDADLKEELAKSGELYK